jgi:hypothetical protein
VSREVVLSALVLIGCGALAWLAGRLPAAGGPRAERVAWWRLWAPLVPAAVALALFVGWALQEPDQADERLLPMALGFALPLALVWTRALIRAARSATDRGAGLPAAVVGLVRPRVILDPRFEASLDASARDAVRAHEAAHARHRDPLRIWLAQLATDLQWPGRAATARLERWLAALELARDDEARRGGARGEDLASALVSAARFEIRAAPRAAATLGSPEAQLAARIDRLLHPLAAEGRATPARMWFAALGTTLLLALLAGVTYGDVVLRALPFVAS